MVGGRGRHGVNERPIEGRPREVRGREREENERYKFTKRERGVRR